MSIIRALLGFLALALLLGGTAQAQHTVHTGIDQWGRAPHGVYLSGSWEAHGTTSSCSGGCTVTIPVAVAAGHEVTAYFAVQNATTGVCSTLGAPGGFTLDGTSVCANSHYTSGAYQHTAVAGETSYGFTITSALAGNFLWGILVMDFTGLKTTTPLDAVSAYTSSTSVSSFTANALTTTLNNDLVFVCYDGAARVQTGAQAAGWQLQNFYGSNIAPAEACEYQVQGVAGAITPPLVTLNTTASTAQTVTFAIKHQ